MTERTLWVHDEDTYAPDGQQLLDRVEVEVRKIVAPLMDGGADTAHVTAIVIEGAMRGVTQEWNRRQGYP